MYACDIKAFKKNWFVVFPFCLCNAASLNYDNPGGLITQNILVEVTREKSTRTLF